MPANMIDKASSAYMSRQNGDLSPPSIQMPLRIVPFSRRSSKPARYLLSSSLCPAARMDVVPSSPMRRSLPTPSYLRALMR